MIIIHTTKDTKITNAARTLHLSDSSELRLRMHWHEWHSLAEIRGNMSLFKVPDPDAYERANYMLMLQSWRA